MGDLGEIRDWMNKGLWEKAEQHIQKLLKAKPHLDELFSLQREVRKNLARLCEYTVEGFEYLGCYTHQCAGKYHSVHEYYHPLTEQTFVFLPPQEEKLPLTFQMGSSNDELDRLYHNQDPHLFNDDVIDAYLPDDEISHPVQLTSPFLIAKTPVTQHSWKKLMHKTAHELWNEQSASEIPANFVSWEMAMDFCQKSELSLPTEAQWEYACRAGTQTLYYWGNQVSEEYIWYRQNTRAQAKGPLQPTQQKKANAFGLFDMNGNVWEWCLDWYDEYPESLQIDPQGPLEGEEHVLRGGSFEQFPEMLRSAERHQRFSEEPSLQTIGFRTVKNLEK